MEKRIGIDFNTIELGTVLGSSVNYVTKAAILDYVKAVEDYDPIFLNAEDAKEAGFAGIVAPPSFHLQYTGMKWATGQNKYVPQGAIHTKQKYKIMGLVNEGDCLTTTVSISDKYEKKGCKYIVYQTCITNQHGKNVCISEMTNLLP